MSTTEKGQYLFLPWIRTGIATQIKEYEENNNKLRATIDVSLDVRINNGLVQKVTKEGGVSLYGPADIVGVLKNLVIRTEPKANDPNFKANYFAHIEFSQPDFPWRFTPARYKTANDRTKLTPWLCLIVLRRDEFEGPTVGPLLPKIKVLDKQKSLPNLEQLWAWAHCQITGKSAANNISNILLHEPHRAISRILCPRRLTPNTRYYAFLVPSFEAGRRAGLGEDIGSITGVSPAWTDNVSPTNPTNSKEREIPFYYHWEFNTGDVGDFEDLALKLEGRTLSERTGLRDLDVSKPFPKVNGISKPLPLGGVLWSKKAAEVYEIKKQIDVLDPSPDEIRNFVMKFKELLDLSEKLSWAFARKNNSPGQQHDPVITPPIYGMWHANCRIISRISADYQDPDWIRDLANIIPPSDLVDEKKSMIERIEKLRENPPPLWLEELNLDPANRIAAGLGAVVVQQHQEELMESAWDQVGAVEQANKRLRMAQLGRTLSKNLFERTFNEKVMDRDAMIELFSPLHHKVMVNDEGKTVTELLDQSPIPSAFFSPSFKKIASRRGKIHRKLFGSDEHLATGLLEQFNVLPRGLNLDPKPETPNELITTKFFVLNERDFVNNSRDKFPDLEKNIPNTDSKIPLPSNKTTIVDLEKIGKILKDKLDPDIVIVKKMDREVLVDFDRPPILNEYKKDKLDPILTYPKFNRPMFEPLRDLSQNLLLPGIGEIPENTVSLLQVNTAFVNSYMAGLNHEMASELLWREYLTDRRGSFFKQFWDPSIAVERDKAQRLSENITALQQIFQRTTNIIPNQDKNQIITALQQIFQRSTISEEDKNQIITALQQIFQRSTISEEDKSHIVGIFQQFPSMWEEITERYRDIKEIHTWDKDSHLIDIKPDSSSSQQGRTLLLIKGELLRKYPSAVIYASEAINDTLGKPRLQSPEKIKQPIFRGTMDPDVTFFGFDISRDELEKGGFRNAGWFFVIQEQHSETNFGIDETTDPPNGQITNWDNLGWNMVDPSGNIVDYVGLSSSNYINITKLSGKRIDNIEWGFHSGHMAFITQQKPFRIAFHALKLLGDNISET